MLQLRDGQAPATAIHRADYQAPAWWIDTVDLTFDLDPAKTRVLNKMRVRRNTEVPAQPLRLDGDELNLARVLVNGGGTSFKMDGDQLVLENLPEGGDPVDLEIFTTCAPAKNTKLMGLYVSQGTFFTQCEAEGFRRITYFLDRPDVMAMYTVTLRADKTAYPVLLSNGNLVEQGALEDGRHFAKWADPHRKPCYLFALVAGNLVAREQKIKSRAGRDHLLQVFVRPGDLEKTEHAMNSLMASVAWDEARFGLSLDLDRFMIVATSDFNMGAMENKGLNVFNTKYVLASQSTATDTDYANIESVVGHEYFHNWTGNRVTCRDWFQLSLKEGLTVFRDQEFGADLHNPTTARIREVRGLRAAQFPEDAGPMAHPVRPASYMEINNFYTATVYEKGAEVVRMIQTLIGREAFRAGMDEYFRRHDGQAVTCDDFVAAMAAASGFDFTQFMRWYSQPGTPQVKAEASYDAAAKRYSLSFTQSNPKASDNAPYLIPIRVALFDRQGQELAGHSRTLLLTESTQRFDFEDVAEAPVPSLLRDFSAPVVLDFAYSDADLTLLLAHDSDPFNAWEAGQRLASRLILEATAAIAAGQAPVVPEGFIAAARRLLGSHEEAGAAFVAEALTLPGEATLAEMLEEVNPDALHAARNHLRLSLAEGLRAELAAVHAELAPSGPYQPSAEDAGRRALRNLCLSYLLEFNTAGMRQLAVRQFEDADNMTDQFAALAALANVLGDCPERETALAAFYQRWQGEALVVDKWLAVQSSSRQPDTLATVQRLTGHPAFDLGNPNKVYALLRTFGANLVRFHAADGAGYRFFAEQIKALDARNPQVASRLARCFDRWKKFDAGRQVHSRAALESLRDHPGLSRDVFEIVTRALG